jgi:hypothetical protein
MTRFLLWLQYQITVNGHIVAGISLVLGTLLLFWFLLT